MKYLRNLIIPLFLFCSSINPLSSAASAPAPLDFNTDWQLGPMKLGDTFDQNLANQLLGSIQSIANNGVVANEQIRTIYFEHGIIGLRGETLISVGSDRTELATPRGILVKDKMDKVIQAYGLPGRTKDDKVNRETFYSYGREGAAITFVADYTGKIKRIMVSFPGC